MILRALCVAALAIASARAESPSPDDAVEAALRRHIAALADDAMEGRRPGTPGEQKAVRYIAAQMQAAGLTPGARGGDWFQPVDLVERKIGRISSHWRIGGRSIDVTADELALIGKDSERNILRAPVIFGGYALPENLRGVDVARAIVLVLPGRPGGSPPIPSFDERRRALARRGAIAVLNLIAPGAAWRTVRSQYAEGRTMLADEPLPAVIGAIAHPAWSRLIAASQRQPPPAEAAGRVDFRAVRIGTATLRVETAVRAYRSVNVIGRLPGSGRSKEAVAITAHWDHLGICRPPDASDRICNGAVDNASGVGALIEIARGLSQGPKPLRDMVFVATTAEESGLLGARAFVRRPQRAIVAGLNLDTVAIAPRGAPVATIGRGMTPLDPFIEEAVRQLGRKLDKSTTANVLVARQDGWELMNAGIPAVMVGGAFSDPALLERFFADRYHKPTDDPAHAIELGGAAEDVGLHVALARLLGDPARFPAAAR